MQASDFLYDEGFEDEEDYDEEVDEEAAQYLYHASTTKKKPVEGEEAQGEEDDIEDVEEGVDLLTLAKEQEEQKTKRKPRNKKKAKKPKENKIIFAEEGEENAAFTTLSSTLPSKQEQIQRENVDFDANFIDCPRMTLDNFKVKSCISIEENKEHTYWFNEVSSNKKKYFNRYWASDQEIHDYVKNNKNLQRFIIVDKSVETVLPVLLKRSNFASCMIDHVLYIHGGTDKKYIYNDTISLNTLTGEMVMHKWAENATPSCSNHGMVNAFGNYPVLITGSTSMYLDLYKFVESDFDKNVKSWQKIQYQPRVHARTMFTAVQDVVGSNLVIFGGFAAKTSRISNELIMVSHRFDQVSVLTPATVTICWPPHRFNHAACVCGPLMFVHGGYGANNMLLNDMYYYNFQTKTWTEVTLDGAVPPPIYQHSLSNVNNRFVMLLGGMSAAVDGNSDTISYKVNDAVFRYDVTAKSWSLIRMLGIPESGKMLDSSSTQLVGHQAQSLSNKIIIFGGVTEDQKFHRKILEINNIVDEGVVGSSYSHLKEKKDEEYMCDLQFKVADHDGEAKIVKAHKAIIGVRCPALIKSLLEAEPEDDDELSTASVKAPATIQIDETTYDVFKEFVSYLYTGSIHLKGKENIEALVKYAKLVDDPAYFVQGIMPISKQIESICSSRGAYLTLSLKILQSIEHDLHKLVNSSLFSDIKLRLGAELEIEIPAHKVILCKSKYFMSMLSSGMKESTSSEVEFDSLEESALMVVLKYLYTGQIDIAPSNCVGVLVYAQQFALAELANYCRQMVVAHLAVASVLQVLEVAELYKDLALVRLCMTFIKKHFDEIKLLPHFSELEPELKQQIEKEHFEHQQRQVKKQKRQEKQKK